MIGIRRRAVWLMISLVILLSALCADGAAELPATDVKSGTAPATAVAPAAKNYALIIGNNNYKHFPRLNTAAADAKDVAELLRTKYGFEIKLLFDATRKQILSTINDFRKKLGEHDNFLIYYAGHGEFDKNADKAYWLPVDALRDDPTDWIMADDITSNIKRIVSRHILLVSDSCYSGTLTRAAAGDLSTRGEREAYLKKMSDRPSRTLMASGGNEPVADSGEGRHSVFAAAFLKAFDEADKPAFTAEEIFHERVKEIVAGRSEQVPEYNNIRNSGHEGGDFVFQIVGKQFITTAEELKSERPATVDKPSTVVINEGAKPIGTEPAEAGIQTKFNGRFVVNGLTVVDNESKLMWARNTSLCYGTYTHCLSELTGLDKKGYAGFNDWRVPSKDNFATFNNIISSDSLKASDLLKKIGFENLQNKYFTSDEIYIVPPARKFRYIAILKTNIYFDKLDTNIDMFLGDANSSFWLVRSIE